MTFSTRHFFGFLPTVGLLALSACGQGNSIAETPAQAAPAISAKAFATAERPVVLELYQSQGCSSCPPANANVNALADRPDVLALSFAVTYWDQLGWKDIFGSPAYTARQWDYARRAGRGQVATPQVVINGGATTVVGSNRAQLEQALAQAGSPRGGPTISKTATGIRIQGGSGAPSTIWLVRFDPKVRDVPIRAGENGGRTLPHRDIVRELTRLGNWRGSALDLRLTPAKEAGLAAAILIQQGTGGPIISARRV